MYKKSAVDLTDLALGIVVLGIVVTISGSILINIRDSQVTNIATAQIKGESIVPKTAGTAFSSGWGKSVDFCKNATAVVPSTNYSYSVSTDGTMSLSNLTGSSIYGSTWSCNYTVYNKSDVRFSVPDDAATGLAEYGNWFKIIVIVGVAAVILALIFMAFGRGASTVGSSQGY